tara:strand:- start:269 stop:997 length:729 start_codon:yes stop_codon:yes gene_type:complete
MADQDYIRRTVEELARKFQLAQEEAISAILGLVEGKSNAEAIAILNELDVGAVMKAKTSGIVTAYTSGNAGTLLGKEMFAPIDEDTLRALLTQSEQYLSGEITAMANTMKQEIVVGMINENTAKEIVENLGKKGYAADVGMTRIVSDGMNNYSRAVTRMMMDEAPGNTKYIYVGPADEKTRNFCLSAIQAGEVTLAQIESMGWKSSLTGGGGINCRHGWEPMSRDVRGQFYQKEEAEAILNA